jgi:hypothetical protein
MEVSASFRKLPFKDQAWNELDLFMDLLVTQLQAPLKLEENWDAQASTGSPPQIPRWKSHMLSPLPRVPPFCCRRLSFSLLGRLPPANKLLCLELDWGAALLNLELERSTEPCSQTCCRSKGALVLLRRRHGSPNEVHPLSFTFLPIPLSSLVGSLLHRLIRAFPLVGASHAQIRR